MRLLFLGLVPIAIGLSPVVTALIASTDTLAEPDRMAVHEDANPPNAPAYVYRQSLVMPAPFPDSRLAPTEIPEEAQPSTITIPVYAQAHLTPAIDAALSEAQMREVLTEAGWPEELHTQALRVSYGESRWRPAVTNGVMLGLFQISDRQRGWPGWWEYYEINSALYADPVTNARLARLVYLYDIHRGQEPWSQWQVKPW